MRIVIDMQGAQTASYKRGIGRYTRAFVRALIRQAPATDQILLLFNGQMDEGLYHATHALRDVISPGMIRCWYAARNLNASSKDTLNNRLVAQQIYAECVLGLGPDLLLMTSLFEGFNDDGMTDLAPALLNGINIACILYDLIPLRYGKLFLNCHRYRDFYFRKLSLLQSIHQVLAISDYSLRDYLAFAGENQAGQLAEAVGAACDFDESGIAIGTASTDAQEAATRPDQFLLFVGSCDPHKNLSGLLKACAHLPETLRSELSIVIAGIGHDLHSVRRQARQFGLNPERIQVRSDCDDSAIYKLYQTCHLFVAPSLIEGFGLPALEAIKAGAVCIGSNRSSLPEVIGCSEALFDPEQPAEMAELIERAWSNIPYRSLVSSKQQAHAQGFTWNAVASKALLQMRKLDAERPSSSDVVKPAGIGPHAAASRIAQVTAALSADAVLIANYIQHTFHDSAKPRRVFVDISEFTTKDTASGIQRVVRSVLKALPEVLSPEWEVVPVYATSMIPGYFIESRVSRALLPHLPDDQLAGAPALMHGGDVLLVLDLQHRVALSQSSFLRALRSRGVSVYFVVYDILPIQYPYYFHGGPAIADLHAQWLELISQMDGYFAISRTVRDQVKEWMRINSPPVHPSYCYGYFHLGADLSASVPSRGLPKSHALILKQLASRPSFLQVSTLEPRKGAAQLLAAFEILWRDGHDLNLVLVGKRGWLVDDLVAHIMGHPELDHRLFWLNGISDEMLDFVYDACACSVMASYGEGFGLPLVEAAQKGLPIIARDIPVFREVAGDAAFFFQAESAEELASSIKLWLALDASGQRPCSSTLPWLSWLDSTRMLANNMIHAYRRSLSPFSVS